MHDFHRTILRNLLLVRLLPLVSGVLCATTAGSMNYRSVSGTAACRDEEIGMGGNSVVSVGDSIGGSICTSGGTRRLKPRLIFGRAWA